MGKPCFIFHTYSGDVKAEAKYVILMDYKIAENKLTFLQVTIFPQKNFPESN